MAVTKTSRAKTALRMLEVPFRVRFPSNIQVHTSVAGFFGKDGFKLSLYRRSHSQFFVVKFFIRHERRMRKSCQTAILVPIDSFAPFLLDEAQPVGIDLLRVG